MKNENNPNQKINQAEIRTKDVAKTQKEIKNLIETSRLLKEERPRKNDQENVSSSRRQKEGDTGA